MTERLGITEEGLAEALKIKGHYRDHLPICLPGKKPASSFQKTC
ncbi:MAG: hypothetical protein QF450_01370 [Rhodospirillales bacterium]|jgi:hypothetical protein|nr:hypothetical protein [Rhodospirillales bacterium]